MIFGQKDKKESNIVDTPEDSIPEKKQKPITGWFLLWNVIPILLYCAYTFFFVYKTSQSNFLSKIVIYLLAAYVVVFLLLVIISLGNRSKMKRNLKNYKSAASFLRYTVTIINFSLSIITLIGAFLTTGAVDFKSFLYAVLILIVTVISIFFEIGKIIIRKNISVIKQNFLDLRMKGLRKENNDDNK